ncbi:tryptophan 2,3-dioxygenase [Kineosporia sp. NBRC 101731]|uniref:tryptophan 2,3-dioxygenase n=1 Tax=Kineosporia sp. NBRC 101731 TaxID=3032199 RepID=UPI0024A3E580|nr:tryptophan 2,3-dioxygenase [Kineosporia sp. NBRC 101731]GLY31034.1 tryptophan 2,3-dioxygenase [Kineosporia sp. NBRC 101731]
MSVENGERQLESGVRTNFHEVMDYANYLRLDQVLQAQHPLSNPAHHDELLFIVQHQTTELWLKLIIHELLSARDLIDADRLPVALKRLARVKHIQATMTEQWSVLATLTPSEYAGFRKILGPSSGFQSYQYRSVEFLLGNKNEGMLDVFASRPEVHAALEQLLGEPTVYDSFLRLLARRGYEVPAEVLERDVRLPWTEQADLVPVFQKIYENVESEWDLYEACEDLVDIEDAFQNWRFRHLSTVQRIIGSKVGTGGSSGVPFLRRALELTFFPELFTVRSLIGA